MADLPQNMNMIGDIIAEIIKDLREPEDKQGEEGNTEEE